MYNFGLFVTCYDHDMGWVLMYTSDCSRECNVSSPRVDGVERKSIGLSIGMTENNVHYNWTTVHFTTAEAI